jgi:hypothetical protein
VLPLLLLLPLLGAAPGITGGHVLSRATARSHAGSTVACKPLLLLLLRGLALLLLLLLLPDRSRSEPVGCTITRLFQNPSSCAAMQMSGCIGK